MWVNLLVFFLITGALNSALGSFDKASVDSRWLRLYQYRKTGDSYVSDINSDRFFFSAEGNRNSLKEMQAAIAAFENDTQLWGTLQLPAGCAFPARKKILSEILDRKFPESVCPDLDEWMSQIRADKASIVFVGAYSGNAASILGHTFLRISNSERESSGRDGMDLLSYSIGYTAHPAPDDGKISYMVKGLTGQYPGFYDIEPYYMKVGLYNNSESRDLWDIRLNLTPEEVGLLTQVIWEYTFNAQTEYYFVGRNCSYRLLKLLEVVRPQANFSENFSLVVLPAETVRVLEDNEMLSESPKFRASVKRRLALKKSLLSSQQREQFQAALKSVAAVQAIDDATLADALLDHWLYENYQVQAALPKHQQEIMDATFARSAKIDGRSHFQMSNQEIRDKENLSPPFTGHKPHWVSFEAGRLGEKTVGGIEARLGVHPFWSGDRAYRDISAIEYFGFNYQAVETQPAQWNLLLARALTLEEFFYGEFSPSWGFEFSLGNDCMICEDSAAVQISGAYGISTHGESWSVAFLPTFKTALRTGSAASEVAPGGRGLIRWSGEKWTLVSDITTVWNKHWITSYEFRAGYQFNKNRQPFVRVQDSLWAVGWTEFF